MEKLESVKPVEPHRITSVYFTQDLANKLEAERIRIGARSRSEVVRKVLELYFAEDE